MSLSSSLLAHECACIENLITLLVKQMLVGKDVADAVFKDLESCFLYSAKFKVCREYVDNAKHHASYVGKGDSSRIRMSNELRDYEVVSLENLFFVAIIVCHECAHYVNKHNHFNDTDKSDFTAIENWADFYGARLFGVIITYGKKTQKIMRKVAPELNQEAVLDALGLALGKIHSLIYLPNTDTRYSPAIERVYHFTSGFTSFFYRLFGELKPNFIMHVLLKIIRAAELENNLGEHNVSNDKLSNMANRVGEIHRKIQGDRPAISTGLKPFYIPLLVTNYHLSSYEINNKRKRLVSEIERIGIKVDWGF